MLFRSDYREKITKKNIVKIREVREDTVIKAFKQGNCEVLVINEENGKEILVDDFSSDDDVRKYLGKKFLAKKR